MKHPNFFIVGAPKCGTTSMNDHLGRHDEIYMAKKELHFFGADLQMINRISSSEYLDHFKNVSKEKVVGEASVWYLFSHTAAAEIKSFAPQAKILIMLRNPVEVMHALHSQHLIDGNEDVADFIQALSLEDHRKQGLCLPDALEFKVLPSYFDSVRYYEQVKRYLDTFGKENVQVILYDDFSRDTEKIVAQTLTFLGLQPKGINVQQVVNKNKRIRWLWMHRLLKKPPCILKKLFVTILPRKHWRHNLMDWLFRQNVHVQARPPLDGKLQMRLSKELAPDIVKLSSLIERELSGWLPKEL